MPLNYNSIEIFTSEEARWNDRPLYSEIIEYVRKYKIAARCIVTKGAAGCYENGETAAGNIEILSYNMPLKIEIILPSAELNVILPGIEEMVTEGIVAVRDLDIRSHKAEKHLIPRQLLVKDVMTHNPASVVSSIPASGVIEVLLKADYNSLPVVDKEKHPIGIISQRDLIEKAGMPVRLGLLSQMENIRTLKHLNGISGKTAGEIMSSPVITVFQDKRLGEAVDVMLRHKFKRLPVIDDQGKLTGMLARFDVFRTITQESHTWENFKNQKIRISGILHVRDIMLPDTHLVKPDTSISDIIRHIDSNNIQRMAVVDDSNRFLGMIFDRDLLGVFAEHKAGIWDYLIAKLPVQEMSKKHKELINQTKMKTASDVMISDIITVMEDTRIDEAIKIMTEKGIKRLPVVDDNGKFKGMVSRDSVLRAGVKNKF